MNACMYAVTNKSSSGSDDSNVCHKVVSDILVNCSSKETVPSLRSGDKVCDLLMSIEL